MEEDNRTETEAPKKRLNLQKPAGTIDFLPEDMDKRRTVI